MRPAVPADTPAIARVAIDAGMFAVEDEGFLEQMMVDYFATGEAQGQGFLVHDDADGLLGLAYYQPKTAADRVWDLTMIAVQPGRQGTGLGTALLRQVEDILRGDGQRLLLVETSASAQFDPARAFYRGNGYDEEARIRDYWEPGDDLIVFRKDLTAS